MYKSFLSETTNLLKNKMEIHDSCHDRIWLIVGYLTSSDKYFMHFQDENRFQQYINKLFRNQGEWENHDNDFWLPMEKYLGFGGENLVFCKCYNVPILFQNLQKLDAHLVQGTWYSLNTFHTMVRLSLH